MFDDRRAPPLLNGVQRGYKAASGLQERALFVRHKHHCEQERSLWR
jgi:hypothetical protein